MPAVLAARLISPVLLFRDRPVVELYVPPVVPVWETDAVPVAQKGLPVYEMPAVGRALMVIVVVVVLEQVPLLKV